MGRESRPAPRVLQYPGCRIDLEAFEVIRDGATHALTPREVALLHHLARHPGEVVSREEILERVWEYHPGSRTAAVGVAVRRLRRKLERRPDAPTILLTIPRAGWKLSAPSPRDPRPLFGRAADRAAIRTHPPELPLVLVGLGGVGKSRLAAAVLEEGATAVIACAPTGVDDHGDLAAALGIDSPAPDRLRAALSARAPLGLLLDGLENARAPAELLATCTGVEGVRVLGTSRVGVPGVATFEVTGLDSAAGRALLAHHHPAVTASPIPVLDAIVERLGGHCLALELAAARFDLLEPRDLLKRLDTGAGTEAVTGRGGPFRAVLDWTIDHLDPERRAVYVALGAFAGPFTPEQAEAVVAADDAALDALSELVSLGLLVRRGPRLHMLDLIREDARRRGPDPEPRCRLAHHLAHRTCTEADLPNLVAAARHAAEHACLPAAVACLEQAAPLLSRRGALAALIALTEAIERPELSTSGRAALLRIRGRALARAGNRDDALVALQRSRTLEDGARIRAHLGDLHRERGEVAEALDLLALALEADPDSAEAHGCLGLLHRERGEMQASMRSLDTALKLHRRDGDVVGQGRAHLHRGIALKELGELTRARLELERSRVLFRAADEARYEAVAIQELGVLARHEGELTRAQQLLEQARQGHRRMGLRRHEAMVLGNLGNVLKDRGRPDEALAAYGESLALKAEIGETTFRWVTLGNMAELLLELGRVSEAEAAAHTALKGARAVSHALAIGAFTSTLGATRFAGGHHEEGIRLVEQATQILQGLDQPTEVAKALGRRAEMAFELGDPDAASALLARAEALLPSPGRRAESPASRRLLALRTKLEQGRQ